MEITQGREKETVTVGGDHHPHLDTQSFGSQDQACRGKSLIVAMWGEDQQAVVARQGKRLKVRKWNGGAWQCQLTGDDHYCPKSCENEHHPAPGRVNFMQASSHDFLRLIIRRLIFLYDPSSMPLQRYYRPAGSFQAQPTRAEPAGKYPEWQG